MLEKEVEGISRKEDGQTRPNVCRSMKLHPSTESSRVENANKVKQLVEHATASSMT
jgi:hypothetical protein